MTIPTAEAIATSVTARPVRSGLNPNKANVSIGKGTVADGFYRCSKGSNTATIQIDKRESEALSYKVSVFYFGVTRNNRSWWTCQINDRFPKIGTDGLSYGGSTKLVFNPVDADTLEIQETDENGTQSVWVDLSDERTYHVHSTPPIVSEKVESLIERGRFFTPADGKKIETIFHSRYAGVFLYAKDGIGNSDIYHAKESEEFAKGEIIQTTFPFEEFTREVSSLVTTLIESELSAPLPEGTFERNQRRFVSLKVMLQAETAPHALEFIEGNRELSEGRESKAEWDGSPLNMINLEEGSLNE